MLDALRERLYAVSNTDELLDIELALGILDEEDPADGAALRELHACRCRFAMGPAPAADADVIARPRPEGARSWFTIRGRMAGRIVRVGWADGALFGSRFAARRIDAAHAALTHSESARRFLAECFDEVLPEDGELVTAA